MRCANGGATIQQWIRPEAQSPEAIAMLKHIELLGTVAGHHPPHVCPICKHYWWFNETLIEDEEWPEE